MAPDIQMNEEELITEIYSAFEPFLPPPEGTYVDCEEVRGRWNVVRELGHQITRSKKPTCQLYSGHRGVGKTTELLRLRDFLEGKGYKVVYFAVDDEDVETQDAEYADILFACTKNLVQSVSLRDRNPLVEWMRDRWQLLKDLAVTEVAFDSLSFEQQISQFSKITASVRAVPNVRRELRARLNESTPSLLVALNSFIDEAKAQMPSECKGIAIIVDNLDRISENNLDSRNNFDEIYLNRSELMRGLNCHVIYTVPIQMIYSPRVTRLEDNYGRPDVLPMVMVKSRAGEINEAGLDKLGEIICRRLANIDPQLPNYIDGYVFDSAQTRRRLCLMSGGHMRVLMLLLQKSMDWIDELPITVEAAQIAIEDQRDTYSKARISPSRWEVLARTHLTKQFESDEDSLLLLLNRCLLEYRERGAEGLRSWCDVHPLLEGFDQFKRVLARLEAETQEDEAKATSNG